MNWYAFILPNQQRILLGGYDFPLHPRHSFTFEISENRATATVEGIGIFTYNAEISQQTNVASYELLNPKQP